MSRTVRIGCPSGFWGDSAVSAPQLVRRAQVDYLMLDYLAEVTMSVLVRARAKDPAQGYARDFVTGAMSSVLEDVAAKGIKVVTNAGGVNPRSCAAALKALCDKRGVPLRIAVVEGDDVLPLIPDLRAEGIAEMDARTPLPADLVSANAYLGALPIAAALARGADIVLTGRCADSALALGILIHEFGWKADDWDRMAAGSLVGHILECGPQATGGLHTDWDQVPGWADIGYPIAECAADGSFVLTKPEGTGGLVNPATVAEQMLYEIGDPAAYVLPDVVADFSAVTMEQVGPDRVRVAGARGRPATGTYKVSATWEDGFRCVGQLTLIGFDAARKAQASAEAIVERCRMMFRDRNLGDFRGVEIEILGADSIYGADPRATRVREVVMRIAVAHDSQAALQIFAGEVAPAGTNYAPGTTGYAGGRPKPQPIVRLFSFLIAKDRLPPPCVDIAGETLAVPVPTAGPPIVATPVQAPAPGEAVPDGPMVELPLIRLAYARSGDKGDKSNIGVIARRPEYAAVLRQQLTAERMAAHFAHLAHGRVERFEVPGIHAFNFLLHDALGGGGAASLRNDAQGKSFAQIALEIPIRVPAAWT
ncbi:acyclic terpene utilization AtuA family protein [Zavarzinia sp. CC-PAN008]|uniref:acyclic terpene utilization AtuA family protein n=1 Tax=Zavarzinia sp. CC-PAN008 TaxID=3243332 RepID=UPI003F745EB3